MVFGGFWSSGTHVCIPNVVPGWFIRLLMKIILFFKKCISLILGSGTSGSGGTGGTRKNWILVWRAATFEFALENFTTTSKR